MRNSIRIETAFTHLSWWSSKSSKYLSTLLWRQKYFLHGIIIEQLNAKVDLGSYQLECVYTHGAVCTCLSCLQATGDFGVYTMWTMKCHRGLWTLHTGAQAAFSKPSLLNRWLFIIIVAPELLNCVITSETVHSLDPFLPPCVF